MMNKLVIIKMQGHWCEQERDVNIRGKHVGSQHELTNMGNLRSWEEDTGRGQEEDLEKERG